MAFWRKKEEEFEKMAELVEQKPGINSAEIAQELGLSKSTVLRRLPSLEEAGILLSEDNNGGLRLFSKRE